MRHSILKLGLLRMVKNFMKLNQTWYGVCHVYLKCKTKKNAIASIGKNLVFRREISD